MREKSWESYWFSKLGNDILHQIDSEVDPHDSMAIRVVGNDTRVNRDERMKELIEMMKATTTRYRYGDYPWNTVSRYSGIYACPVGNRYWDLKLSLNYLSKSSRSFLLRTYNTLLPPQSQTKEVTLTSRLYSTSPNLEVSIGKCESKIGWKTATTFSQLWLLIPMERRVHKI